VKELKNLNQAVVAVMKQVRYMEKNSRVGSGNAAYDGTKDSDVKEAFNVAMAEHGLCIFPISVEEETDITRWEEKTQWGPKQKQSVFTKVRTKYLLVHESGESIELAGYGHGVDPQDKAAGKALTYALKNTLLYSFLTPVGKIEDTDRTHSNDIETPQKPASKPTAKLDPRAVMAKRIEADKDAKWFEVVAWEKGPHKGLTLGDVAANGDPGPIKEILDYIDPVALEHATAVKRLKEAITEAKSCASQKASRAKSNGDEPEDNGDDSNEPF
jgi:hypothetical protein